MSMWLQVSLLSGYSKKQVARAGHSAITRALSTSSHNHSQTVKYLYAILPNLPMPHCCHISFCAACSALLRFGRSASVCVCVCVWCVASNNDFVLIGLTRCLETCAPWPLPCCAPYHPHWGIGRWFIVSLTKCVCVCARVGHALSCLMSN